MQDKLKLCLDYLKYFAKWLIITVGVGLIVGVAGAAFAHVLAWVNALRAAQPKLLLGLPLGGVVIVWLYRVLNNTEDKGTNTIISAARGDNTVTWKTAPLIFVSTAITHLFGGSAGREGAALQLGGSIANSLCRLYHLDSEASRKTMIMCGMAAGFTALFGTPLAAAVFALEVACVGVMEYSALFPCVVSAMVAHFVAEFLQVPPEVFHLAVPDITPLGFAKVLILSAAAGGASILFCMVLHKAEQLYKQVPNPYARAALGGILVVVMATVWQAGDYLGSGMGIIEGIFHGEGAPAPLAFLLKMLFTAVTLGAGFKGGEIVPSFTIGATLGFVIGPILGLDAQLAAACGMIGLFCGVTNCPLAALMISFELFGFEGMPWYLTAVAVSYLLSGHHGLYHVQAFRKHKLGLEL